ncbi:AAA domain-containing protein [Stutzerimonas stutzeri]|uniref:DEAD/DEAH box helicase n=1 Tax=Stutzerimonas stutzeri TaxID=316 RepID=UPI00244B0354|nr:ATP-binding protein [Stutzerimonas stutzeri]MDH0611289.1 AAA domain-containing protein [Stutzerimonas stutzeri]
MTSNPQKTSIIKYWQAIEFFTCQQLPREGFKDDAATYDLAKADLPWKAGHPSVEALGRLKDKQTYRHTLYFGCIDVTQIDAVLEKHCGKSEVMEPGAKGLTCFFSLDFDCVGLPKTDSFVLSTCGWAASKLDLHGVDVLKHISSGRFREAEGAATSALTQWASKFSRGDAEPPTMLDLKDLLAIVLRSTSCSGLCSSGAIWSKTVITSVDAEAAPDMLNSFFIKDLEWVAATSPDAWSAPLKQYIGGPLGADARIDVSRREVYLNLSLPARFPHGRWPAKPEHSLVFSQQVAVNALFGEAPREGLFSVNGPPGTGKTTLLKDIIANIVVERAKVLAALDKPERAFKPAENWQIARNGKVIHLKAYPFIDALLGFEIVVASANNGAVENVTREIPAHDAICSKTWDESAVDHFPELGAAVAQIDKAWGLCAAPLGKMANRSAFTRVFWKSPNSFKDWLSTAHLTECTAEMLEEAYGGSSIITDAAKIFLWKKETLTFQSTLAKVETLSRSADALIAKIKQRDQLALQARENRQALDDKRKPFEAAKDAAAAATDKVSIAEEQLTRCTLQILKIEQQSIRWWDLPAWMKKRRALGEARRASQIASAELTLLDRERGAAARVMAEAQERYATAESQMQKSLADIAKADEQIKAETSSNWGLPGHDYDARELSMPWLNPGWAKARSDLFIAALRLHRVFMMLESKKMKSNLSACVDWLDGRLATSKSMIDPAEGNRVVVTPPSTLTIRTAKDALFFAVPVVSTSFASMSRLFSDYGRGAYGWLLIDEAGQAAPQMAVGALARSRRAVIVGDPVQLEPVVTVSVAVQETLRKHQDPVVGHEWMPCNTSVQELADQSNPFGTWAGEGEDRRWIGSPLVVHRRCDNPMFSIANQIAYNGKMVFGVIRKTNDDNPSASFESSSWIDISSNEATDHWIPAEGEALIELVERLMDSGIKPESIFVISPFRSVVAGCRNVLRGINSELYRRAKAAATDKNKPVKAGQIQVGTVHTVQGKEADTVVMVLGGNPERPGAKEWAAQKPNLLNVGLTRAKRRIFIIGNRAAWSKVRYFQETAWTLPRMATQAKVPN